MMVLTSVILQSANYRPHCKCHFLSTCLQYIVANQLIAYLDDNEPSHQLGFHRNDSTETLLLRLLSDFYSTLAHGQATLLSLQDVSSAFDSVDHPVLIVPSHLSWLGEPVSRMT